MAAVLVTAATPVAHAEPVHGERAFITDGTFTVPADVTSVFVAMWGSGGGGSTLPETGGDGATPPEAEPPAGTGGGGGGAAWCAVAVTPATTYTVSVGVGGLAGQPGTDSSLGEPGSPALVVANGGQPGTSEAPGRGGAANCDSAPGLAVPGSDGRGDRPGAAGVVPSAPPGGIGSGGVPGQPGAPGYVFLWW